MKNVAKVKAFFGNADVAVKMDTPGTFTLNGARVDADAAIMTSFEMMQMGLKYLAYSSGIAVADPASGGGSQNTMRAMPEIEANKQMEHALALDRDKAERHFRAFLAVVDRLQDDLSATNRTVLGTALKNIKEVYKRYRDAMNN